VSGALPPISNEDLHGFVDGEMEGERRDAIVDFLAASPVDAARVEMWRRQNEILRSAFARVETEPPLPLSSLPPAAKKKIFACPLLSDPERKSRQGQNSTPRIGIWKAAIVKFWRDHRQSRWLITAFASGMIAATVAPFFSDRLRAPTLEAPQAAIPPVTDEIFARRTQTALLAFAPQKPAKTIGAANEAPSPRPTQTALVVPNLSAAGLTLVGVRIAPSSAGDIFCLFYAKAEQSPAALCVEPDEAGAARGFRLAAPSEASAAGSPNVIIWRQNNAKYALAGRLSEAELRDLATRINAEVEAFGKR
jgi:anti-sigma factor RsiW